MAALAPAAERAIEVCEAGGFVQWLAHARVLHCRLRLAMGEPASGPGELAAGLAHWTASGAVVARSRSGGDAVVTRPFYLALQAEGLLLTARADEALPLLTEALAWATLHGERFYEPELQRLMGELLLAPSVVFDCWGNSIEHCDSNAQLPTEPEPDGANCPRN